VTCPLERVFVDLCRPKPCRSQSGQLYSMNVIDDFSSYIWSLPLRNKEEAASVFQLWHCAVENQSGHCLKILVSNNGKLISNSMHEWASTHGVDHQQTAPYMSAQNRCAEHLHCTLLGKARAMCLSCNAPLSFWDKFCAMLAYLSNLTASSSLNGKTPYKMWTSHIPSLSHLCKIRCHAFALIQTHNPKIYHHSEPCILIGYTPHTKVYCLWDMVNGSIFNSFHVTFLEHLDKQPVDLLPGTTVCIEPDALPSWDAPSCPTASAPIASPSHSMSLDSSSDNDTLHSHHGENGPLLMPLIPSSNTTPGKNHQILMPGDSSDPFSSPSIRQLS